MWASGTTTDGSSSVPARTNITSGRVYSLNTATWRETALRTYGRGVPPLYAVPYERRIAAPLLVVGSKGDPLVDEADVDRLLARAWSSEKRAVLVDDAGHGWGFLLLGHGIRGGLLLRQWARMHHDKAQFLLGDPSRAILHLDPAEYTVSMPAARRLVLRPSRLLH